ncbi:MAG: hypothetical protein QUT30_15880 [Acidobacteriota bacterium]|nr:hypothetical protein [Acidobacteriota bacterium]
MKYFMGVVGACLALTAFPCFGQSPLDGVTVSVSPGPEPGGYILSCTVSARTMPLTILVGRPYSGEEVSRQEKMLSDGTRTLQPVLSAIKYRDTAGRIRTERRAFLPMGLQNGINPPVVPEIVDPVAGFIYYLDTVNRVAHRMLLSPESFRIITKPTYIAFQKSTTKEKDLVRSTQPLGTDIINGIEAQGGRITTTYPAGTLGNENRLVTTLEIWTSPELGFTVRSKNSDPRTGEFTNEVINIKRGEPDPSLFEAPPDYDIVDEPKVPFTFIISSADTAKR